MNKQQADSIITEYLPKIYGFAVKRSYSYDEAEEISAEIVKEVYTSLLRFDDIVNIEGYIWRISEHTYSKYVSSKKKHEGVSIDGMQIPYYEDYYSGDAEADVKRLRREIAFLTQRRRSVVYKFYYENRSVSDISRALGIPEGTVKWHLNKARNELKEGFSLERKIGKLGLSPIKAKGFGHGGNSGKNGAPEFYLEDKINLNIVYSVYHKQRTVEEIAEELGMTLVFLEDRINYLENNGFLVKVPGNKYTTFVWFDAEEYSLELKENRLKIQKEIAEVIAEEYVPQVRRAVVDTDAYIPGGNRELLEAAAITYCIVSKCGIRLNKDLSKYRIRNTGGGDYIAYVHLDSKVSDPDYKPTLGEVDYWMCGSMNRWSDKYPSVYSWSVDTRYSSRKGAWENNRCSDYDYLYEYVKGDIKDDAVNGGRIKRLRERGFLTKDGLVNVMMVKDVAKEFFGRLPKLDESIKERFAKSALDITVQEAKNYPVQMQDLIMSSGVEGFIGSTVALMVLDMLYESGTFKPLTETERITSNLLMFSDLLPNENMQIK